MPVTRVDIPPLSFVFEFPAAAAVAQQVKVEDVEFRSGFRPSLDVGEDLTKYVQQRYTKQLDAVIAESVPDLMRCWDDWSRSLLRKNQNFLFDLSGVPRKTGPDLSNSDRTVQTKLRETLRALRRIRDERTERLSMAWRLHIADIRPQLLSGREIGELRDSCKFRELLPAARGMYAIWHLDRMAWRLVNGPESSIRAFKTYASFAAHMIEGNRGMPEQDVWQRWLYLQMPTAAFSEDRTTWEEGRIFSVCEASATFLDGKLLRARRAEIRPRPEKAHRFYDSNVAILTTLIELGFISANHALTASQKDLDQFCSTADARRIPTPARWAKTWSAALRHRHRGLYSHLYSLVKRARERGLLHQLMASPAGVGKQ